VRIFLAGASGVIGVQLVPLLLAAGHDVAGMTRSAEKAASLAELGAEPVVCDVYDQAALRAAVVAQWPELVMHQLTDLPDRVDQIPVFAPRNNRIRTEGTRNLIAAAAAAGAERFVAQSISWTPPAGGEAVEEHERAVLDYGGLVLRYGQFYGPGTFHEHDRPDPPRIHVADAARRTVDLLDTPGPQAVVVTEAEDLGV
jgi:nucleoside-diphosphate-sugar epimerase